MQLHSKDDKVALFTDYKTKHSLGVWYDCDNVTLNLNSDEAKRAGMNSV